MTDKPFKLTLPVVQKVLATVDKGLVKGLGVAKPGQMCVEAAVCYALGLPHSDKPMCVDPAIRSLKVTLNDSDWSSNKARAAGLRKLSVLQLGTNDNFDSVLFAEKVALYTVNVTLAETLTGIGLTKEATACKVARTLTEAESAAESAARSTAWSARSAARSAAWSAARSAARSAAWSAADSAARSAAWSARSAQSAAWSSRSAGRDKRDGVLATFGEGISRILIDMAVPAVKFLKELDK